MQTKLKFKQFGNVISITEVAEDAVGKITIPSAINGVKVTGINKSAFLGCNDIHTVVFPNSITHIDFGALSKCAGLKFVTLPDNLQTLGEFAFSDCPELVSIIIPKTLKAVPMRAFTQCYKLARVTIGESVIVIEQSAFASCKGLTSIVIPDSVKTIMAGAFQNCTALINVTLGEGVTSIGENAFAGCVKLGNVNLPANGGKTIKIHPTAFPVKTRINGVVK